MQVGGRAVLSPAFTFPLARQATVHCEPEMSHKPSDWFESPATPWPNRKMDQHVMETQMQEFPPNKGYRRGRVP